MVWWRGLVGGASSLREWWVLSGSWVGILEVPDVVVWWADAGSLFLRRGAGRCSARMTLGGWICCRDFCPKKSPPSNPNFLRRLSVRDIPAYPAAFDPSPGNVSLYITTAGSRQCKPSSPTSRSDLVCLSAHFLQFPQCYSTPRTLVRTCCSRIIAFSCLLQTI